METAEVMVADDIKWQTAGIRGKRARRGETDQDRLWQFICLWLSAKPSLPNPAEKN